MTPKVQIAILGSAIACLAIGLAASVSIRNEIMANKQKPPETLGKTDFIRDLSADLDDVLLKKPTSTEPLALTAASCAQAGGKWNECGSLCRGKPAGTVCAEVCVPQCECFVGQCPVGYGCAFDTYPAYAERGVCQAGAKEEGKTPLSELANNYRSADGVTGVHWHDIGGDGTLANGFQFHGTSTAFENVLSWRVVETSGRPVAQGTAYVDSPDAGIPGAFEVIGFYDLVPKSSSGTLQVYEASAKDGTPLHVVNIPVTLVTSTQEVTVYWSNTKKNPNMADCSKVFPVKHKIVGGGPANWTLSMHELLKGPTPWEISQGYQTSIPDGVALPKVGGSMDGRTILDFGQELQQGVGGSCRTANIRAQIEKTWGSNSENVGTEPIISIDGRTEDVLQP